MAILGGIGAIAAATTASATPNVAMDSAVFVEKSTGKNVRQLEPARQLRRGDRVVTIVSWYRMGGNGGFVITNPLPRAIAYESSAREDTEVSVDGGKTWGKLSQMRIGSRVASPEDVTHVRWRIAPGIAASGKGHLAYSGVVR